MAIKITPADSAFAMFCERKEAKYRKQLKGYPSSAKAYLI